MRRNRDIGRVILFSMVDPSFLGCDHETLDANHYRGISHDELRYHFAFFCLNGCFWTKTKPGSIQVKWHDLTRKGYHILYELLEIAHLGAPIHNHTYSLWDRLISLEECYRHLIVLDTEA